MGWGSEWVIWWASVGCVNMSPTEIGNEMGEIVESKHQVHIEKETLQMQQPNVSLKFLIDWFQCHSQPL